MCVCVCVHSMLPLAIAAYWIFWSVANMHRILCDSCCQMECLCEYVFALFRLCDSSLISLNSQLYLYKIVLTLVTLTPFTF